MSPRFSLLALLVGTVLAVGCNNDFPGLVPVSGTVTIDGQPVSHGGLTVHTQGHRPSMARLDDEGQFTLTCRHPGDGVVTGTHLVTVSAEESLGETSSRWHAPKEYSNPATSGLWVTIDGPTDDLKIELTWDKSSKEKGPFVEKF
jgi:hypothetical protein